MILVQLVLVSHGPLASGMLGAAKMIIGEMDNVTCISLEPEHSIETLREAISAALAESIPEQTLLLTDLFGGSPFNCCAEWFYTCGIPVVAGLNLPLLLTAATERNAMSRDELARHITDVGSTGVRLLEPGS